MYTAAAVAALFDDGTDGGQALQTAGASHNYVVVVRDTTNNETKIFYVDADSNASNAVAASEVTLVGTLSGYSTVLADANIAD